MLLDTKAQVGETITWIVATIIIILILIFSIFIVSFNKKTRKFELLHEKDLLVIKSLTAYLLTESPSGKIVFEQLKDRSPDELFNDFNGPLAKAIFYGFYKEDYLKIWLGAYTPKGFTKTRVNDYFGGAGVRGVSDKIQLDEDKYLLLTLTKSN